jgi:hypothetical protein
MKKLLILITSITFLISCESEIEKPDPFLQHDEMVDIMTDISLAEGSRMYARPDLKDKKDGELTITDYYALVFTKYDITQAQLDSINSWYVNYPDEYQAIFKEVLDRLNKMQAEEKAISKEEAKKKADLRKKAKEKKEAKELKKTTPVKKIIKTNKTEELKKVE